MSSGDTQMTVKNIFKTIWFWGVVLGVFLLWGLNWYMVGHYITDPAVGGQFGDRFGATTSLFSGFTILGLIITIVLQQNQISLQRHEIDEQSKQLVEEKKEKRRQDEISVFFHMMNFQVKTLEKVATESATGIKSLMNLKGKLNIILKEDNNFNIANEKKYLDFLKQYSSTYLHHINAIQSTFDHIVLSNAFTHSDKIQFTSILKSQLSTTELALWSYHLNFFYPISSMQMAVYYEMFEGVTMHDVPFTNHLHLIRTGKSIDSVNGA